MNNTTSNVSGTC